MGRVLAERDTMAAIASIASQRPHVGAAVGRGVVLRVVRLTLSIIVIDQPHPDPGILGIQIVGQLPQVDPLADISSLVRALALRLRHVL